MLEALLHVQVYSNNLSKLEIFRSVNINCFSLFVRKYSGFITATNVTFINFRDIADRIENIIAKRYAIQR